MSIENKLRVVMQPSIRVDGDWHVGLRSDSGFISVQTYTMPDTHPNNRERIKELVHVAARSFASHLAEVIGCDVDVEDRS